MDINWIDCEVVPMDHLSLAIPSSCVVIIMKQYQTSTRASSGCYS
jgi:hypothetical protein